MYYISWGVLRSIVVIKVILHCFLFSQGKTEKKGEKKKQNDTNLAAAILTDLIQCSNYCVINNIKMALELKYVVGNLMKWII